MPSSTSLCVSVCAFLCVMIGLCMCVCMRAGLFFCVAGLITVFRKWVSWSMSCSLVCVCECGGYYLSVYAYVRLSLSLAVGNYILVRVSM